MLQRSELVHQFADRFQAVWDHPEGSYLTSCFGHRDSNCLGVKIETDKAYF